MSLVQWVGLIMLLSPMVAAMSWLFFQPGGRKVVIISALLIAWVIAARMLIEIGGK